MIVGFFCNELIFALYLVLIVITTLAAAWWSANAMTSLMALYAVLMNLFVLKEVTFFGLSATASDALGVGAVICLNVMQELYGKRAARDAIWISFSLAIAYTLFSVLHCAYVPSVSDTNSPHFTALLSPMPRLVAVSLVSYLVTQSLDRFLYGKLTHLFAGRYFVVRNYITVSLTQFLDTLIFTFLGLAGLVTDLWSIVWVSFSIKLVVIFFEAPMIALCMIFLKKRGTSTC